VNWQAAFTEHGPRMLAVARWLCGSEAEEAVREAVETAREKIATFRGPTPMGTWLHRITVNSCLARLRKRGARPTRRIEDLLPKFTEAGEHAGGVVGLGGGETGLRGGETGLGGGETGLAMGELRSLVREKLAELPDSYRVVLVLRDIERLDTAETARLLEISESSVQTRLHRARLALLTLMRPQVG
jgi:RNA polymerase sigma-70 factor, ECF subfamily